MGSLSKNFKNIFLDFLEITLISTGVFALVYIFAGQLLKVTGDSMIPTLANNEQIISEKLTIKFKPPQRGDIIVFKHPEQQEKLLIKRVIGLSTEDIKITDGYIYINGTKLNEPYLTQQGNTKGSTYIKENESFLIPPDFYVLLGDNRNESADSRQTGPVSAHLIIGRAFLVFQPWENFRLVTPVVQR